PDASQAEPPARPEHEAAGPRIRARCERLQLGRRERNPPRPRRASVARRNPRGSYWQATRCTSTQPSRSNQREQPIRIPGDSTGTGCDPDHALQLPDTVLVILDSIKLRLDLGQSLDHLDPKIRQGIRYLIRLSGHYVSFHFHPAKKKRVVNTGISSTTSSANEILAIP